MSRNEVEQQLIDDMASFSKNPLGFVMYAFEWGKSDLEKFNGPDEWAKDILIHISENLSQRKISKKDAIQIAVSSGHGIGKSCLVAWITLWALSTFEDAKIVITANTEAQLRTKTWPEIIKWHSRFIARHWFKCTATAIHSTDKTHEKIWRADAIAWSENNTEAFAGLHNQGKRIVLIFDEASAISDKVWDVAEGALTDSDTEILWFAFGNPTRNAGRFRECFRKLKHRWFNKQVDSRNVEITNKDQINKWIEDYGENSDFVKIRVKGEFPSSSDRQFISSLIVDPARGRQLNASTYHFASKIVSVDPAWTGGDETVIGLRQGLVYRELARYSKNDNDLIMAGYIAKFEDEHTADAVFIDQGYGTGVYSAGKSMGRNWILVPFGSRANDVGFANKRAEMWNEMKKWLQEGGCIPDDPKLADEICSPEYEVNLRGQIILESKEDMRKRGLPSPNRADALAISFAFPVIKKNKQETKKGRSYDEYEPYGGL